MTTNEIISMAWCVGWGVSCSLLYLYGRKRGLERGLYMALCIVSTLFFPLVWTGILMQSQWNRIDAWMGLPLGADKKSSNNQ